MAKLKRAKLFHKFVVKAGREIKNEPVISGNLENLPNNAPLNCPQNLTPSDNTNNFDSNVSELPETDAAILNYNFYSSDKSDAGEFSDKDDENELQVPIFEPNMLISDTSENSLKLQLVDWSLKNNISHLALTSLLHILKPMHPELPLDARTLLRTERTLELKCVQPGQYFHIGFRNVIENMISVHSDQLKQNIVELCVNIDGLPLAKSSSIQCYPILCKLFGAISAVHIIGIYHGNDKPSSANKFLEAFVDEAIDIINNGISCSGKHYNVKIKAFICDVPAKSFIKYTRGHSGYTKCTAEGIYVNRRICFPETSNNLTLRTDSDFRNKAHEQHHTGTSVLENLPGIDMIRAFPNEYMYLICLGVVKKLIVTLWIDGNPGSKLSFQQVSALSDSLLTFKRQIPTEFNRKTRPLMEVKRWKATEFRLFLFYVGPVVLRTVLSRDKYVNFFTLNVAMTILASDKLVSQIEYANL